jgi:hypothetical protein
MDAATAVAIFNLVKGSPQLLDAAVTWLQATKVFIEAINAAETAKPAP